MKVTFVRFADQPIQAATVAMVTSSGASNLRLYLQNFKIKFYPFKHKHYKMYTYYVLIISVKKIMFVYIACFH